MPIKFRCQHCRQLLGISRTKAGQVADCPTCGRSVRVPELDGRRDPLPPPELNLDDSRLAGALNELAQIGLNPADAAPAAARPDQTPQEAEVVTPEPLAEPIPIEPPPPAEPKEVEVAAARGPTAAVSAPVRADDALAELARDAGRPLAHGSAGPGYARRPGRPLLSFSKLGALLGAVALGFGMGFFVGQGRKAESVSTLNGDASGAVQPANGNGDETSAPAVKGRITYKNEDGDSRPDRKARVFLFPKQRDGKRKLDVIGLRAGDSAADFQSAAAAFEALGGRLTRVNEEGGFEVSLPAAGTYQMLVISNYQSRQDDEPIDNRLERLLSEYFDRPEQLLGRFAWRFDQVRYKGAEAVLWDHSF